MNIGRGNSVKSCSYECVRTNRIGSIGSKYSYQSNMCLNISIYVSDWVYENTVQTKGIYLAAAELDRVKGRTRVNCVWWWW